jgi:hypothetical protein
MKLIEILKFYQVQEAMKIAAPEIVRDIQEMLILAYDGEYIMVATEAQIKEILSNDDFITFSRGIYNQFVKHQFADNNILMNKWLRYANNIRSL